MNHTQTPGSSPKKEQRGMRNHRFLALVLVLQLVISLLPMSAFALDSGSEVTPENPTEKAESTPNTEVPSAAPDLTIGASSLVAVEEHINIIWDSFAESNKTYNLMEQTDDTFTIRYRPLDQANGIKNTVLEIKGLAYGAKFFVKPGEPRFVKSSVIVGNDTILIQLKDGLTEDIIMDLKMETTALTQAQAEQWMDEGTLPSSGLTVNEYTGAVLSGSTIESAPGETVALNKTVSYGSMVPENTTTEAIQNIYSYDMHVSSLGALTNFMLGEYGAGRDSFNNLYGYVSPRPVLYYGLSTPHINGASLMEITGIKVYVPSSKLNLIGLSDVPTSRQTSPVSTATTYNASTNRAFGDFDQVWNQWTIGERQTDTSGDYYILTPPSRYFNISTDGLLKELRTGMRLLWSLADETDELPYAAASYTDLDAANTEVMYRIPATAGAPTEKVFSHIGPKLHMFARENTSLITHAYAPERHKEKVPSNHVVIGAVHVNRTFTYTTNSYFQKTLAGSIRFESVPTYAGGPIVQTFEFPYEIQPTAISLSDQNQYSSPSTAHGKRQSVLKTLTYTTADNVTHAATAAQIAGVNAEFSKLSGNASVKVTFANATASNYVTQVVATWDSIETPYRWGYPFGEPIENTGSGSNVSLNNTNGLFSVRTGFDYRVMEHHDAANTQPIHDGDMAQVKYNLTADGNVSSNKMDDHYLWFKFQRPICPELAGSWWSNTNHYSYYADGTSKANIGSLYLNIGAYGERIDDLQNPVIDLTAKFSINATPDNTYDSQLTNNYSQGNLAGIKEEEGLAFLTGKFIASPELSGWVFTYTTNKQTDATWTVPTSNSSHSVQIPLEEGEYFKKISLHYSGTFSTAHSSPIDSKTSISLMSNIEICLLNQNPFTGEVLSVKHTDPFTSAKIMLDGYAHWDNCIDLTHIHEKSETNPGQKMLFGSSAYYSIPPHQMFCFARQATLTSGAAVLPTTVKTIYQGADVLDTFRVTATPSGSRNYFASVGSPQHNSMIPWKNINEGVYIELTDSNFFPDLSKTTLFGVGASSENVISSVVTVNGRRFLKMQFAENFYRKQYNASTGDLINFTTQSGFMNTYSPSINAAGPITIAFNTLPGTPIGVHHPIGKVYLDYSELLDTYAAPGKPNDQGTDFTFPGAVADPLGLSISNTTEPKLFEKDFSAYTVNVQRAIVAGANLVPGAEGLFDFSLAKSIAYFPHQKDELESLFMVTGDINNDLYDYTAYLPIPRKNQSVSYYDTSNMLRTAVSEHDMFLRGIPEVVTDGTGVPSNISYSYTTDANPGESSSYTSSAPTSPDGWKAVTGVKIVVATLTKQTSVNVRLGLSAAEKTTAGILKSYLGGTSTYRQQATSSTLLRGYLPLSIYTTSDYPVNQKSSTLVWYDGYDENGLRSSTDGHGETAAAGITVTLYDNEDPTRVIDTAVTDENGQFQLYSYKRDPGQTIVVSMPQSGTWKLTKQSPVPVTESPSDSDFNRNTSTLVLPQLPNNGLGNISAGLIRLPELEIGDITVAAGDTEDITAILHDYLGDTLPDSSYNITFESTNDPDVATVETKTVTLTGTGTNQSAATKVTGVKLGTATATVVTKNTLGDTVTATFHITVRKNDISVNIIAQWADNENALVARPESVKLQLWRNVEGGALELVGDPAILSGTGSEWQKAINDLPKYSEDGKLYIYSVTPVGTIPNYTATASGMRVTYTLKTVAVSGVKTWVENISGFTRPENIKINLYRSDAPDTIAASKQIYAAQAVAGNPNQWAYSFDGLVEFDPQGNRYTYTIDEATVPEGYIKVVSGTNITNFYGVIQFEVMKVWDFEGAPADGRPQSVTVNLMRDGQATPFDTAVLNQVNQWKHTFIVSKTEADGHTFEITENAVTGYRTSYSTQEKVPSVSTTITNKYIVPNSGGDLSSLESTVTLIKVDAADQKTVLPGAKFELYKAGASKDILIGTYTTDSNGIIIVPQLGSGSYYWAETSAPGGYKLDTSKINFTLTSGNSQMVTVTNTRSTVPPQLNGDDHFAYIIGRSDGHVHPESNITRAEAVTIFFRLLKDNVRNQYKTKSNQFHDVSGNTWFCTAVSTLASMGIINGTTDGKFEPNKSITRAEFAAIAARFDESGNADSSSFQDIYQHWGKKEISIAASNGWVLGYEDGSFRPDQLITRAEAMAMINRVLQRMPKNQADLLTGMVQWPDNADVAKWYYLTVQEATNSHFYENKSNGYEKWTKLRDIRDWANEFEK